MEPDADGTDRPDASRGDDEVSPAPAAGSDKPVDRALRATYGFVAGAGAVITVATLALGGLNAGLGAALGAALATANLWIFARVVSAFLERRTSAAPWAVIAVLKLGLLLGALFLIVRTGVVSPASLGIGYGALPIGIVLAGLFGPKPPP